MAKDNRDSIPTQKFQLVEQQVPNLIFHCVILYTYSSLNLHFLYNKAHVLTHINCEHKHHINSSGTGTIFYYAAQQQTNVPFFITQIHVFFLTHLLTMYLLLSFWIHDNNFFIFTILSFLF